MSIEHGAIGNGMGYGIRGTTAREESPWRQAAANLSMLRDAPYSDLADEVTVTRCRPAGWVALKTTPKVLTLSPYSTNTE